MSTQRKVHSSLFARMREATGTVYGDIGTSVLYTINEVVRQIVTHRGGVDQDALLGGLSLIFWSLVFLTVKYDLLIMRATSRGEGGTFALWGLLKEHTGKVMGLGFVCILVVVATGMLVADGLITPVISILGAYEPLGKFWAVIATIATLALLFKVQWRGTGRIGGLFGFFMMFLWFPWLASKGLPWILEHPEVLKAVNPLYALTFLVSLSWQDAFLILGVVVLAITGGEAMYADMGHFGRKPMVRCWRTLVLPCLLLNYAGQVAYVFANGVPDDGNVYYALTPFAGRGLLGGAFKLFDVIVSTIAAVIASQALISGVFSLVKQAIPLGFSPRFEVRYTDRDVEGRVYIPTVNWMMFAGCVMLTLFFQSASHIAGAYGIAVTVTMAITTITFSFVARNVWHWRWWRVGLLSGVLLFVDFLFLVSTLPKIREGGMFPIVIAVVLVTGMLIWQWGRRQLSEAFNHFNGKTMEWLVLMKDRLNDIRLAKELGCFGALEILEGKRMILELPRAVVFLTSRSTMSLEERIPPVIGMFLEQYGALPRYMMILHVDLVGEPEVPCDRRCHVTDLGAGVLSVTLSYGFMEEIDVRRELRVLEEQGRIPIPADRWMVETGEEEILVDEKLPFWQKWRIGIFRTILRLSTPAHMFFGLKGDPSVSKEVLPVEFTRSGVRLHMPELDLPLLPDDSRSSE